MTAVVHPIKINGEPNENFSEGYIKLFRSIRKHWLWQDPEKLKWWIDILLSCNHASRRVSIGFDVVECDRGQTIHSQLEWSKRWKVDRSTVRRFLDMLEKEKMIVRESVSKTTRITVCNYISYNDHRPQKDHVKTTKTTLTQHKQELKELKEDSTQSREWKFSHKGFFDRQLEKNKDAPTLGKYQKLVEWLHEKDEDGNYRFGNILSLERQMSYKDYVHLKEAEQQSNRTLKDVLEAMEDRKTLAKDHKNVYLTAKAWLRMEFKNK